MHDYDAIIVGGGPAGLTAAIQFARAGRSAILLERNRETPSGPGETFHPGIEPIFERLGVGDAMRAASSTRHNATVVEYGHRREVVPYGQDWRGFQIRRQVLNDNLKAQLATLGGKHSSGIQARNLAQDGRRHIVETDKGPLKARWLFDASGMMGWLDRRMATKLQPASKPIWLRYGYDRTSTSDGDVPRLRLGDHRWDWRAPLGDGETAWVDGTFSRPFPDQGQGAKGADGTWRLSPNPAIPGVFRLGDAACRLDPSNGHGVLRAMMSAIMATHLALAVDDGMIAASKAVDVYSRWISHWFTTDAEAMRALTMTVEPDPLITAS